MNLLVKSHSKEKGGVVLRLDLLGYSLPLGPPTCKSDPSFFCIQWRWYTDTVTWHWCVNKGLYWECFLNVTSGLAMCLRQVTVEYGVGKYIKFFDFRRGVLFDDSRCDTRKYFLYPWNGTVDECRHVHWAGQIHVWHSVIRLMFFNGLCVRSVFTDSYSAWTALVLIKKWK